MDSDALLTFLAIHRAGGFSRAADQLGRTQPAISRRLALFEEELSVPLFERTREGVVLSQAGRVLLPYAERVAAMLSDASDAIADVSTKRAGPVSLALVGTLAGAGLSASLKRFSDAHPDVDLSLCTATSDEVSELVRRGDAVIGLRYFDDPAKDLITNSIGTEQLVVICSPNHPHAQAGVKSLRNLKSDHWLAFPNHFERRDSSVENLFAQFLTRGVATIDWSPIDSLTAQKRLVEAGFGLGFLPVGSVQEELASGSLATISVADLDVGNPVFSVTRKQGYLSEVTEDLLAFLKKELGLLA